MACTRVGEAWMAGLGALKGVVVQVEEMDHFVGGLARMHTTRLLVSWYPMPGYVQLWMVVRRIEWETGLEGDQGGKERENHTYAAQQLARKVFVR